MFFLIISFIFLPALNFANDCSPALGGKENSPERKLLENMPNIDQGNFGICYAHSAAFLYDYYRFAIQGQKMTSISSPLEAALSSREAATREDSDLVDGYLAYNYHSKVGEKIQEGKKIEMSDFEGGGPTDPLQYLIEKGSCDQFVMDQMATSNEYRQAMRDLREFYYDFQTYKKHVDGIDKNFVEGYFSDYATYDYARENYLDPIKRCLNHLMQTQMGRFIDDDLILELLHQASPVRFVNDLVFARCNNNRQKLNLLSFKPEVIETRLNIDKSKNPPWDQKPEFLLNKIDSSLESSPPRPIEIGHCSLVYSRSFRVNRVQPNQTTRDDYGECGPHSAVVAGRKKFDDEKCRYLVINWNGGECKKLPNAICDEGTGGYWITKEDLGNATWNTIELK